LSLRFLSVDQLCPTLSPSLSLRLIEALRC
jgi:hypothetical protein